MGVLQLVSGLLASFHDSFTLPHAGTGLEVHGTAGSLVGVGNMGDEPAGELMLRRSGTTSLVDVGPRESLFVRAVADFTEAIRSGRQPAATADDGIRSLATALAARESARDARVVSLAELDERLA